MKKITFLLLAFALMLSRGAHAGQTRKVLIIGLDGVRSDALQAANTPNLDRLIANGFYTYDSWCLGITVSGPSWSTIFTGVWYQKHGVTDNSYAGSNYNKYPYYVTRAKEVNPNIYAVQIVDWAPMSDQVYNDGFNQKIIRPNGNTASIVAAAQVQLQNPNLDALTVYINKVDGAGHGSGFSPSNAAYISAIEETDMYVGQVVQAVYDRPNYDQEDWLILVTTDHGGLGTSHGGNSNEERQIWWIGSGKNVQSRQVTADDPGSYRMNNNPLDTAKLKLAPTQADIAVTALHHLVFDAGVRPDDKSIAPGAQWDLDGKSWLDSIRTAEPDPTEPTGIASLDNKLSLKAYPNPTTGALTLWFDPKGMPVSYTVSDMNGRPVQQGKAPGNGYRLNLDLNGLPEGTYYIHIVAGDRSAVHKIIKSKS